MVSRNLPEIWLVSRDDALLDAWRHHFDAIPGIKIVGCRDVRDVIPQCRTIVSPAQSFGVMDGGIDMAYTKFFGWNLQERLREIIQAQYYGELHVGQSCVVQIDTETALLSAPTMRVPQLVGKTTNAYIAFRAILIACLEHHLRGPVLVPGLCTGVGRMDFTHCAHQMRLAWDSIHRSTVMNLGEATRSELRLLDRRFDE